MHTLTLVGVGLIGGSIGLAAKKRGLVRQVRGVGRNRSTLERAQALSAIDEICLDLTAAASGSDCIILCTPVDRIAEQVLQLAPHCRPGTLITDAGSTKGLIVQAVEDHMPAEVHFVGSHPLAGSEKRGPEYANADLFQNRWTIVTQTPKTDGTALNRVMTFWQQLGARVRIMEPQEHDRALAMTSHLPHLLASALAGILPAQWKDLTASGFRDTTRIAAGDADLWTAIFNHNRQALLVALQSLEGQLSQYRQALERNDDTTITHLLAQAKKVRDALGS
jgi:cyclohexadieny/prephenate dehydrogenase